MNRFRYYYLALLLPFLALTACSENNRQTETAQKAETTAPAPKPEHKERKVILFFGNSLTAGYGLESDESFPARIQAKMDSAGYNYKAINAGVSGETTSTGKNRVGWVLDQQEVSIFVLELGANDGLRGIPVNQTKNNLLAIIDSVNRKQPQTKIVLAGMMVPPNMGATYSNDFKNIFPEIAKEKNVELIPFLLEGVAAIDSLNLPDGIHPNASGQKLVARNVWEILEPMLEK